MLAYHLLRDADQMNDALQDTFVKAWCGLPSSAARPRSAPGCTRSAIASASTTCAGRRCGRPARSSRTTLADPADDVGGLALRNRSAPRSADCPVEQRAVLLLVDREGYDYGTVAEALEVPVGTVASRLSLARAAMRRALRPEDPGEEVRR